MPRSPTPSSPACDRLIAGEMLDQFVTDFIQGGAGTSTNMNANEVIANLALESLGHAQGRVRSTSIRTITCNYGQSTNDVYPTALRLALILRLGSYIAALRRLQDAFFAKGQRIRAACSRWGARICRTRCRCRSAPSSTAGAPPSARRCSASAEVRQLLHEINLGATAIGTSVTAAPGYPELATRYLSRAHRHQVHPRRRPGRGDLRHRRLCAAVRRAQAHRRAS